MGSSGRRILACLVAAACGACAAPEPKQAVEPPRTVAPEPGAARGPASAQPPRATPAPVASRGAQELARGIGSYEDGEYKVASKQLQAALDLGLETRRDEAKAHKYLAFIVCINGKEKACREQFRKALDADPAFELEPAEAGNPVWKAALRSVKAERAAKKKPK
jgi:hypothetical protein